MALISISTFAQDLEKSVFTYDKLGNVQAVEFSKSDKKYNNIKSANDFFREVLKVKDGNYYVRKELRVEKKNESFEQYYKGIKVENAGYTFHYDENGRMTFAHGKYVDISNLDVAPVISNEDAWKAFAIYEGLSPDSITQSSSELIIKSIKGEHSVETPLLVYKVLVETAQLYVTEYGYVDANTGKVVKTESYLNHSAATGTFVTKYYGQKSATTDWSNNKYSLYDHTRGNGIEVMDLNNVSMYNTNYNQLATIITDTDNYWDYNVYTDSTFMALDVFCAFQNIYDRLYNAHGKNGIDNNGKKIKAYVKSMLKDDVNNNTTNGSCWDNTKEEFFFGEGRSFLRPFSSLDIVAHECGHAITHFIIGWSHDQDFLNEGLSDIWGCIMDYRYGDVNAEVWKIGEYFFPNTTCLRDIEHPDTTAAFGPMANTYDSERYNEYVEDGYNYGMSGPFSHWFYLLVNGGQGYNSKEQYYEVDSIGMDIAESLIVKAIYDNYLENTTTYEGIRAAFIAAARAMNIGRLVSAVCDAWHAVGVDNLNLSIDGSDLLYTQGIYTVEDLPAGSYVEWSLSGSNASNFTLQANNPSTNQCTINRLFGESFTDATNVLLIAYIMRNGTVLDATAKYLVTPYISGPSDPCGSAVYNIAKLPAGLSVDWSINPAVSIFFNSILTTNSPQQNQCTITNNGDRAWRTNLYAAIKNSVGDTIATLVKPVRSTFDLLFSQEGFYGYPTIPLSPVESNETIIVNHKCWVELSSPYFDGMTIWHTGASPQYFDTFNGHIGFRFSTVTSNQSMTIHGTDGCKVMNLHVQVTPNGNIPIPMLEANPISGGYEILLTYENDEEATRSLTDKEWTLNVVNASSSEKEISRQVKGQRTTISTANWKQGVYVLQGIVDGQECTKKIVVK